ncbi:polyketide synthase [Streptomyces syringium]|uniref:polyketide synthase n=1 Tax=Streptomyces syringium TaxID=76729 RepID=UPI0027DE1852|nr:polyketide synthase [Streptomyces syringium]
MCRRELAAGRRRTVVRHRIGGVPVLYRSGVVMAYRVPESSRACEASVPLAVVGVACRLPGGITGLGGLWSALLQERELISRTPPADRFDAARFCDPDPARPGRAYTMAGGYLEDVTGFDPEYFGISPREAKHMDPQQRMLLEMTAEALDDAAIDPAALAGSDTAVFVGISDMSYGVLQTARVEEITPYSMSGSSLSIAANRLSYAFDFRGPSMAVDTACSSSLIAVHQACEALRAGVGRVAVAGGAQVLLSPYHYIGFSKAMMLSPRGRCAAFSAQADGYVRAEGGGVVVLKRLADALADGDRVHAVIAASGTNCDGRTSAMTVPSTEMQRRLLGEVYERAGAAPDQLLYFEAHGTGTPVGDPLECRAVGEALGVRRTSGPLPFGSVKTSLGHLEPASGMAGLFKGMLVLRHGLIPASLHAEPVNPDIDFAGLNLRLVAGTRPVARLEGGVVGVNSFGFGGANAHVVLEAAPPRRPAAPAEHEGPLALMVSARSRTALAEAARTAAAHARTVAREDFYDLCWTASQRRGLHPHRAVVLATGPQDAAEQLEMLATDETVLAESEAHVQRPLSDPPGGVAFVFCGNGTQWTGMGAALMAQEPVFRRAVEEADAHLEPLLGWSVAALLATDHQGDSAEPMTDITVAQPALFAFQVGLVAMLEACGVRPAAVLGHSSGEIPAAYACGALDLAQAARVVDARSRAQAVTAGTGRMAAVGLSENQAREAIAPYGGCLEVAAVNSGRDVTVAGRADALRAMGHMLAERGVFYRELAVDHGFHSALMDVVEEPLRAALAGLEPGAPRVPMYSTVTGAPVEAGELDGAYWWHNVRRPVRFADAVRRAVGAGLAAVVEIAPQPALSGPLHRLAADAPGGAFPVVSALPRGKCDGAAARRAATRLLAARGRGAMDGWFPRTGHVADLPPYPWQRERYWHGTPEHWIRTSGDGVLVHPLLGERAPGLEPRWYAAVERTRTPWLTDHRIAGVVVMPAAGYVEMALAAAREVFGAGLPAEISDLDITRALALPWDAAMDIRVETSLSDEDGIFRIASSVGEAGGWRLHARGRIRPLTAAPSDPVVTSAVGKRLPRPFTGEELYAAMKRGGLEYGPAFRVLRDVHAGDSEVLAAYRCEVPDGGYGGYIVHPALLDGALQAGTPLMLDTRTGYLPAGIDRVRHWARPAPQGLIHVRQRSRTTREVVWDIAVLGCDGAVAVELTGCRLHSVGPWNTDRGKEYTSVLRAAPLPGQPVRRWTPPSPSEVAAAARRTWHPSRETEPDQQYAKLLAMRTRMNAVGALRAFEQLLPGRETFTFEDLVAAGVQPRHEKLVRLLARTAQDEGLLADDHGSWRRLGEPPDLPELSDLSGLASWVASVSLQVRFAAHLADLWCGRRDPLDLMFQDSGPEMIQQYYDLDPSTRVHNRMATHVLSALLRAWPRDRPLRILEVGAGTGGLAAHLLPLLDDRAHYTFTDISATFFPAAQARFDAHIPRMTYRTLDLDTDPVRQGYAEGSFDLVIAGYALHTAADLRAGLRRLARLTAPGGHLMTLEVHDLPLLAMVFGTLENFWHAQDRDLRPDSILLPRRQWLTVLADSGFEDVVQPIPEPAPLQDAFSVLLARTPPTGERQAAVTELQPPAVGSWLLFTEHDDEEELARLLAGELAAAGCASADVTPCPPDHPTWQEALAAAPDAAVVLMLGSAHDRAADRDPVAGVELAVGRAAMLRCLARAEPDRTGRPRHLVLVTHPSGALPAPERPAFPGQATVWAATRTLAHELPIAVRRISLDRGPEPAQDAVRLARELLAGHSPEDSQSLPAVHDEVALTHHGRFVHCVQEAQPATRTAESGTPAAYRLELKDQGLAYRLRWTEIAPFEPGPEDVVIAVHAAA